MVVERGLFAVLAANPARMGGFGTIERPGGGPVTLDQLGLSEIYLNADAADELHARPRDTVIVFAGGSPVSARVRDVVRYEGAGNGTLQAFRATRTLDPDIAMAPISGLSVKPKL